MTLPKKLQEKRDKLAEQSVSREFYELHEADARVRHFKHGFDSAFNLLLPEIKKLEEALKYITSDYPKSYIHDSDTERAQKALQSLHDFLGEESGGDNDSKN